MAQICQGRETFRPPTTRTVAGSVAAVSSGLYLAIAYATEAILGPDFVLTGDPYSFVVLYFAFALVAVGVPLWVWLRHGVRSPLAVLALVMTFWHSLPVIGSGGHTPVFALALVWSPVYLVAYAVVGGIEYGVPRVRARTGR